MVINVSTNSAEFFSQEGEDLTTYDVYLFRGMGTHRWEMMVFAKYLYDSGKIVIEEKLGNGGRYTLTKLPFTLASNGIPVIPTKLYFSLNKNLERELQFPLIVRSTIGSQGKGIYKAETLEEFKKIYKEIGPKVITQPYLPIKFDYRVFIVGEKVLGVMKKYNSEDSFLTNISAGGRAESSELPEHVLSIALKAKEVSNVEIAGVDVLEHEDKYFILEVNAIPQFEGFEGCTKINVAKEIVEYCHNKFIHNV
jgi:RimK family alpha-L-glutamate ligase